MSTAQYLYKIRQPESRKNLVASTPVEEGQKLPQELGYSWKEFQGLAWTMQEEF